SFLNTYLNAANWQKVLEAGYSPLRFDAGVHSSDGASMYPPRTSMLQRSATADLGLHEALGRDAVGASIGTVLSDTSLVTSELLRVYLDDAGRPSTIMRIPSEVLFVPDDHSMVNVGQSECDAADLNQDDAVDHRDLS